MTFDFTFANIAENDNFYSALFKITNKFSKNTTHATSERMIQYNATHWYVKIKVENPTLTKNISLESKHNRGAKNAPYGSPKVSNKISTTIV